MSDPLKNSDIEDVLSSIRRLVSEEPNARIDPADDAGAKVERLVLTPAFRVPEEDKVAPSEPDNLAANDAGAPETAEAELTEAETSIDTQPSSASDTTSEHDNTDQIAEAAVAQDPQIPEAFEAHADWDDPKLTAPAPTPTPEAAQADAPQQDTAPDPGQHTDQDETAIPERRAEDSHPDADIETTETLETPEPILEESTHEEPSAEEPTHEEQAHEEPTPDTQTSVESSLEHRIAELEAALQNSTQDWEPDGSEDILDDETTPLSATVPDAETDLSALLDTTSEQPDAAPETEPEQPTAEAENVDSLDLSAILPETPEAEAEAEAIEQTAQDTADAEISAILEEANENANEEAAQADEPTDLEDNDVVAALVTEPETDTLDWVDSDEMIEVVDADVTETPEMIEAEPTEVAVENDPDDPQPVWEQAPVYAEEVAPAPVDAEPSGIQETQENQETEVTQDFVHAAEPEKDFTHAADPVAHDVTEEIEAAPPVTAEPAEETTTKAADTTVPEFVLADAPMPETAQAQTDVPDAESTPDIEDPLLAAAMPSDAEEDQSQNILRDDAATIDEDTLREMISELVRQELQGALGERITRNVRRLVRREIQRAMAMRDLE